MKIKQMINEMGPGARNTTLLNAFNWFGIKTDRDLHNLEVKRFLNIPSVGLHTYNAFVKVWLSYPNHAIYHEADTDIFEVNGVKFTEGTKFIILDQKIPGHKVRVEIDGKIYDSIAEGAKHLGITPKALYARLNSQEHKIDGHICKYADKEKHNKIQSKFELHPIIKELEIDKTDPMAMNRLSRILKNDKINTLEDLIGRTENDMLKTPNFGKKCMDILKRAMAKKGLYFTPSNYYDYQPDDPDSIYQNLELSVRAANALANANITKISELINMTKEDFMKIPNFGEKSFRDVAREVNRFMYQNKGEQDE